MSALLAANPGHASRSDDPHPALRATLSRREREPEVAACKTHPNQGRSRFWLRFRALTAMLTSSATWKSNMPAMMKSAPWE